LGLNTVHPDEAATAREIISLHVHMASHDIVLFCNLMAGYEGVAIVRTVDPANGHLELLVAPDFYATAVTLLHVFSQEIPLQLCAHPQSDTLPGDICVP
jgi:Domain of unknown function (DUF4911)